MCYRRQEKKPNWSASLQLLCISSVGWRLQKDEKRKCFSEFVQHSSLAWSSLRSWVDRIWGDQAYIGSAVHSSSFSSGPLEKLIAHCWLIVLSFSWQTTTYTRLLWIAHELCSLSGFTKCFFMASTASENHAKGRVFSHNFGRLELAWAYPILMYAPQIACFQK